MNQQQLVQDIEKTFKECLDIVRRKNSDYAKEDSDAFHNFRFSGMIGVDPRRAILVRITDKIARISNLLSKEAKVKDESIDDTLNDAINYLAILKTFIHELE